MTTAHGGTRGRLVGSTAGWLRRQRQSLWDEGCMVSSRGGW